MHDALSRDRNEMRVAGARGRRFERKPAISRGVWRGTGQYEQVLATPPGRRQRMAQRRAVSIGRYRGVSRGCHRTAPGGPSPLPRQPRHAIAQQHPRQQDERHGRDRPRVALEPVPDGASVNAIHSRMYVPVPGLVWEMSLRASGMKAPGLMSVAPAATMAIAGEEATLAPASPRARRARARRRPNSRRGRGPPLPLGSRQPSAAGADEHADDRGHHRVEHRMAAE